MALTKVTGNGLGAFTQDGAAVFNESSADTDFRIESNGNANMLVVDAGTDKIGIGTAAPTVTLEVANASNPALSGVTNRNPIIQLTNTDTGYVAGNATAIDFATSLNYTNASIICRNDNSGAGYGGSLIFATSPTSGNSLTERMRILPTGGLTFNGDTAAANALEDYEEGTFTATVGSGITVTSYDHSVGHYVKVGRMVTAWVFVEYNGSSRTGSHFIINGLPFTSSNDTSNEATMGGFITYQNNFSNAHNIIHVARNNNKAFFYEIDGSDLTGSELSAASGEVRFVVQYTVP